MRASGRLAFAGAIGLLIGLAASFAAPRSYASQILITLEGPPTPQSRADLIRSLAERAWTRVALANIIDVFGLYPAEAGRTSLQNLTTQMRKQISSTPADATNTRFVIRFEYGDPHIAQQVVADLWRRLTAENNRAAQLGIPGADLKLISPPSLSNSPLYSVHWVLILEGFVGGLAIGALLLLRLWRRL